MIQKSTRSIKHDFKMEKGNGLGLISKNLSKFKR